MMTIFEIVPKPTRSLRGIQSNITPTLMMNVAHPILSPVFRVRPSAKTVQGAFPIPPWINSESPRPKIAKPKKRIAVLRGVRSQRP
jgi:hypothetical protein